MKITKNTILNTIGILIIILSLLRIYTIINSTPIHIFWLCNHIPLIIGISILARNSFLLAAETSLLFAGSLNWSLDFLSKLIFDQYLLGSTSYIFAAISTDSTISILSHLGILPLALLAIFLIKKPKPKAWHGSLVHMLILAPIPFYFGKFYNLNCLLEPCASWLPNFPIYPPIFFATYLVLFVIPTSLLLAKMLTKRKKSKKTKKNNPSRSSAFLRNTPPKKTAQTSATPKNP